MNTEVANAIIKNIARVAFDASKKYDLFQNFWDADGSELDVANIISKHTANHAGELFGLAFQSVKQAPQNIPQNPPNSCTAVLKSGKRKDQVCGLKAKANSEFCARHSKKSTEPSVVVETPQTPRLILRKHKVTGDFWHSKTRMVFKSQSERVVVGKMVDDSIENLTDEDIAVCKKWKFPYVDPKQETPKQQSEEKSTLLKSDDKFWEITLSDVDITVRFGKVGNNGTSKTTSFPSTETALTSYKKQIAVKKAKGYSESGGSSPQISKSPKKVNSDIKQIVEDMLEGSGEESESE